MFPRVRLTHIAVALLLVLGVAASSANAAVPTFYVSPNGSDDNNGTSPAHPWLTLSAAGARLPTAGSWALLLARNGTWLNEALDIDANRTAGGGDASAAAHLTVGAYGPASLPHPLIMQVRNLNNGGAACVRISNIGGGGSGNGSSSLTIRDLHVTGCSQGIALGADPVAANVEITGCVFLDIKTPLVRYSPPNPQWAPAISLLGRFRNASIHHNIAARIDVFFSGGADGLHLNANTVQQCSGNCYSFGPTTRLRMENSVALRDMSERLFMYGTTDVIVGNLAGDNAMLNNDFNERGEYQGGPDGCAFDFETSATGFLVQGNTFYRSWGSGIMIFGHATTSHNVTIAQNVFAHAGCVQNRPDSGGIAVMCPNDQRPSGSILNNTFFTCPDVPALNINPHVPGCADNLRMAGNVLNPGGGHSSASDMVEMPQLSFNPPGPMDAALSGTYNAVGVTRTANATIRYTLDGSRPTEESPVLPAEGINLPWPGPVVAVNLRAFRAGMLPSVTNGAVWELNYVLGRMSPDAALRGPGGGKFGGLVGNLDGVAVSNASSSASSSSSASATTAVAAVVVKAHGWAVDPLLPRNGWGPVTALVFVDGEPAAAALATESRPDLVKAGVAPNPEHGFNVELPAAAAARLLGPGTHVCQVKAIGTPSAAMPTPLPWESAVRFCNGKQC